MAYKALYRTYRPQKFSEVIGQEVIVRTLQNSIATGKITHAYLFSGPRGTGKTTVARILAKALNCEEGPTSEPCGKCVSCREIADGNNPDVIEIDGASNTGVDDIREIREKVKFLPGGSKYKIYIIDEVHMLSQSAFNALLKTLEEPPKHVIFILATTEPHKVLPTILSRCQRYDFKSLTVNEIVGLITRVAEEEDIKITNEAKIAIAESAEGGMRDALSYFDQAISLSDDKITIEEINSVTGNLSYDKTIQLAKYFESKEIGLALKIVNDLLNLGKEVNKIIGAMLQFYRDVLLYKNVDTSMFSRYIFEKEEFKNFVNTVDIDKIFYYVDVLSDVQAKIKFSTTPHIFLEVALIKMINVSGDDLNLIKKYNELEEKISNLTLNNINFTPSDQMPQIDNEKIIVLEEKINRVINELSRMELPKFIQQIKDLSQKTNNENFEEALEDLKKEQMKIKETLELLKITSGQQTSQTENLELSDLETRIGELEKAAVPLKEEIDYSNIIDNVLQKLGEKTNVKKEIDYKEVTREVLKQINQENLFDNKNEIDYDLIVKNVIETLSDKPKNNVDSEKAEETNARLEYLEEKVSKLLSGVYANQTIVNKKGHGKVNENQIVLFGNEMVGVNEIDKKSEKEKYDFGELTKENSPKEMEFEYKEEIIPIQKSENSFSDEYIKREEKQDSIEVKTDQEKPVTNKPNSQVVITKPATPRNDANIGLFSGERNSLDEELNEQKKKLEEESLQRSGEVKTVTEARISSERPLRYEDLDEFEKYDVRVVERILNNSQAKKKESKEMLTRIAELWKNINQSASYDKQNISEVLSEGEVVVVGDNEIIITFKNSAICNQVMRRQFRREAINVIRDCLGSKYIYLALPKKIWLDKRTEYINQYFMGTKEPKLKPIDDPTLNVGVERKIVKPEEELVDNVKKLFGNLVETRKIGD
ncbi:MAG: DNA polymerase III subunit gamma/tau [Bacilli bacterium]|nr:DNA polymerase III subunit gamma/tau [Bacilli bacterium]